MRKNKNMIINIYFSFFFGLVKKNVSMFVCSIPSKFNNLILESTCMGGAKSTT